MRKYRTVLGLLLLLCILLNSTGCNLSTRYTVFSDESRTITHVSSAMRDYIGIVLESEEVVICDYKGHELCRKTFEKRIVNLEISAFFIGEENCSRIFNSILCSSRWYTSIELSSN